MKDRKLAVRYARALLSVLSDPDQARSADEFLLSLRRAMDESREFRDLMLDPSYSRPQRLSVLRELATRAAQPATVGNFLRTLVENNRLGALPSIAEVFHEEREERAGIVPAEIATATPLTAELQERARAALQRMTGREVRLTCRIETGLIGGAVTRVGSRVYDGSLRTQLTRLRRIMALD